MCAVSSSSQTPMQPDTVDSQHYASDELGQHTERPSPFINRLPFDIFQIIFALEEDQQSSAWTVSHVCRLWREYAFAMPMLWNSLAIVQKEPNWEMLEANLERSREAPLDIYLGKDAFWKRSFPNLRKAMKLIVPHMDRWRTLQIKDVPHKVKRLLLDLLKARPTPLLIDFKLLQSKRIRKDPSPHWSAKKVFNSSAALASVTWEIPIDNLERGPRFRDLKSLTTGRRTFASLALPQFLELVWRILTDSPALEHLELVYDTFPWYSDPATAHTPIVMPILTHQSLRDFYFITDLEFKIIVLNFLMLPAAQRLSPRGSYMRDVNLAWCRKIATQNNLPSLRVIIIGCESEHSADEAPDLPYLTPALRALTNLRDLTLSRINFKKNRWMPDLGHICPQLTFLAIEECKGYTIAAIKAIVIARIKVEGMSPLETLRVMPTWGAREGVMTAADRRWFGRVLRGSKPAGD